MTQGLWLYGPDYGEDGEGGVVAVVELGDETDEWRMIGVVATCDYTTAHAPRDGVDQLVEDIRGRHIHRRGLESCEGIGQVESETYGSFEDADSAARRWLDDRAC